MLGASHLRSGASHCAWGACHSSSCRHAFSSPNRFTTIDPLRGLNRLQLSVTMPAVAQPGRCNSRVFMTMADRPLFAGNAPFICCSACATTGLCTWTLSTSFAVGSKRYPLRRFPWGKPHTPQSALEAPSLFSTNHGSGPLRRLFSSRWFWIWIPVNATARQNDF